MRRHGRHQLLESHRGQALGGDLAVDAAALPRLELVDVVEQGGDLDQAHVDRHAPRRTSRAASAATRATPFEWTTMPSGSRGSSSCMA